MPSALDRFFRPRSVALVGATEKSIWSNSAYENLSRFGFGGKVHLVNPRGGSIYKQTAATSCIAVGEPIDSALLMVPEAALEEVIGDVAAAGVGGAVLLSSGFAETGSAGAERQRRLTLAAQTAGLRLLGPNCLGYVNYLQSVALWGTPLRRPIQGAAVAVVSQSGATAAQLAHFAHQQQVGFTHMVSTGNEADLDVADAIEFLAGEDQVRAIALFMEGIRRPEAFIRSVGIARSAGKAIVVLKVGSSVAAARAAQSHTGALVGDDRVFSAMCRRWAIRRVHSIEDLVVTADLIARIGPLPADGLALVGMSGGMCEIAVDQAEREGAPLASLQPETIQRLRGVLPSFATPNNPLDVTGAALIQPAFLEQALHEIAKDSAVGLVAQLFDAPIGEGDAIGRTFLKHIGAGLSAAGKPALMLSHNVTPVSREQRALSQKAGIVYSGAGLTHGMTAIGHLVAWSRDRRRAERPEQAPVGTGDVRPVGERGVLDYLAGFGVPVIPGPVTSSAEEAVAVASSYDAPVVLKVASPDVLHKTEVGGVLLNLRGAESVREGWEQLVSRVRAHCPAARIDGVIVSPMRQSGVELFVGTMRDPQWGPIMAVGLGGIFVEALKDTSIRPLPVTAAEVLEMFDELSGRTLLDGFRGAASVNRELAAQAVEAIGCAALALGDDLVSLEVNPLLASHGRLEALDALAVWKDSTPHAGSLH